jgi:hypothetical protein
MTSKAIVALRVKASRERAFDVFVREIEFWWRPNDLFRFTRSSPVAWRSSRGSADV